MTNDEFLAFEDDKTKVPSPAKFKSLWQLSCERHYPDTFFHALRITELSSLRSIYKQVGDDFEGFIEAVVGSWEDACRYCCEHGGAFNPPNRPVVWFLYTNLDYAYDWYGKKAGYRRDSKLNYKTTKGRVGFDGRKEFLTAKQKAKKLFGD